MIDCGIGFYCPAGSSDPTPISSGYYVIPEEEDQIHGTSQMICPSGFYCDNGMKNECGLNKYCPIGSSSPKEVPEGYIAGPDSSPITQKSELMNCTAGYYCSGGSMIDCGIGFYCPAGSPIPIPVPNGYYSGPDSSPISNHFVISLCLPGHYCMNGSLYSCPAGFFGDSYGLSSISCSGACHHGFICPSGSSSSFSIDCGNATVYCPTGSSYPLFVDDGYYSGPLYVDEKNRFQQWICPIGSYCVNGSLYSCPPGVYGLVEGLSSSSCSGVCPPGFYCPEGSTDYSNHPCGSVDVYCPEGSDSPIPVPDGFISGPLSVNVTNRYEIVACPPGHYCVSGNMEECPPGTYGNITGLSSSTCSGLCPLGYYCPTGTVSFEDYPCSNGYYGSEFGLWNNTCSGVCSPGYFCPPSSTNSTSIRCGGAHVYCPSGSDRPLPVPFGWCSGPTDSDPSTRSEIFFPDSHHLCMNGTYPFSISSILGYMNEYLLSMTRINRFVLMDTSMFISTITLLIM